MNDWPEAEKTTSPINSRPNHRVFERLISAKKMHHNSFRTSIYKVERFYYRLSSTKPKVRRQKRLLPDSKKYSESMGWASSTHFAFSAHRIPHPFRWNVATVVFLCNGNDFRFSYCAWQRGREILLWVQYLDRPAQQLDRLAWTELLMGRRDTGTYLDIQSTSSYISLFLSFPSDIFPIQQQPPLTSRY